MSAASVPTRIAAALAAAGIVRPTLVLDDAAFQRNIARLRAVLPNSWTLRLADKSLPVPGLLARALDGLNSAAIMSFHVPLTRRSLAELPVTDVLMGKPVPAVEAATLLRDLAPESAAKITWLIDSMARLQEYRAVAEQGGYSLRVAFEVDIGLGRGGFASPQALHGAVVAAKRVVNGGASGQVPNATGQLMVVGIMGYDAHVMALPRVLGGGDRMQRQAMARLAQFAGVLPVAARRIINTGGSTTLLRLGSDIPANDVTVGSLLVKPTHFEQPQNVDFEPAVFIVSPVLKRVMHTVPGHPRLSRWLHRLRLLDPEVAFIHGGQWLAEGCAPAGLKPSPFFGASSNQQGFAIPRGTPPFDQLVLRPTQSEAVLQQFGELHIWREGAIVDAWPCWSP